MDNILENDPKNGTALEQAIKEAAADETFRKVKRMSYSGNASEQVEYLSQSIIAWINIQSLKNICFDKCISYDHLANNLFKSDCVNSGTWSTYVQRKRSNPIQTVQLSLLCVYVGMLIITTDSFPGPHRNFPSRINLVTRYSTAIWMILWAKCLLFMAFKYFGY